MPDQRRIQELRAGLTEKFVEPARRLSVGHRVLHEQEPRVRQGVVILRSGGAEMGEQLAQTALGFLERSVEWIKREISVGKAHMIIVSKYISRNLARFERC